MPASSLSARAGSKIVRHGAKYPWANVFGLLLESDTTSTGAGEICDALPLFHTALLGPTLQVALLLVAQHCANTNTRICGAYYSGEPAAHAVVKKCLEQIQNSLKLKSVVLLIVKPALELASVMERANTAGGGEWRQLAGGKFTCDEQGAIQLARGKLRTFADFEDTLEDPALDFRNEA